MKIVLYESGSRGGNFDYSRALYQAYQNDGRVSSVQWIIPHAEIAGLGDDRQIHKILCNDRREYPSALRSKLAFLYRTFRNPLILFGFLLQLRERHYVILNDFEQLSAILWAPLYSLFLKRHVFLIVLHDPDRDAYPPSKWFSELSMKMIMRRMKFGLFHEQLPVKPYYDLHGATKYLAVAHGSYERSEPDKEMLHALSTINGPVISIIGNVRVEKNYEIAIRSLRDLPSVTLVIAGSASSSSVDVEGLRQLAADLKVSHQVRFVIKYLSSPEMSAVIQRSSLVILNYKLSFTSQSGILNTIAPFKKKVIISDTASALTRVARQFGLGYLVRADDEADFRRVLSEALSAPDAANDESWSAYLKYASWENHVNIVLSAIEREGV